MPERVRTSKAAPARRAQPVIDSLEGRIRGGRLKPGDCLPSEKALGAEAGVSRTVVREALQALKARGVLESRRGSGTYVAEPRHTTIRDSLAWYAALRRDGLQFLELMDLRILIESECARLLAGHGSPLGEVRSQLQRMERERDNLRRFANADIAFHLAVAKASGHSVFNEVAHAVLPAIGRRFARQTHTDPARAAQVLEEHRRILRALESRDPAEAEKRMRAHLRSSRANLLRLLAVPEGEFKLGHV